jgi:hypothetical protein
MFLIFGTTGRWSRHQHDSGEFFCPKCGGDRQWVRCVLRRWFSLFFIPLVPMGKPIASAVQCTTCGTRFDETALEQPTASVLSSELQGSMRLAVTAVVRATGPSTSAAAVDAVRNLGFDVYQRGSLDHDVSTLELDSLDAHLAYLSDALSLDGRERFLATLAGVADSGGDSARRTARSVLEQIGARLAMSPAHVAGVLATSSSSPVSRSNLPLPAPDAGSGWAAPPSTPGDAQR